MIDLRSDTVTLPTEEMREAMRRAELGDDSREGDPTVRRLEELAAAKTGKEAGLFVASGTMSNLVALLAHTGRGGEVLLDGDCHVLRSEMGGVASLAGLFYRPITSTRGAPDLDEIAEHLAAQAHRQQARHRAGHDRDHAQQRGRGGDPARLHGEAARAHRRERRAGAHRRRARVQCGGRTGRPGGRDREARRQRRLLRQQGPERAVRLGAVRLRGVHREGARLSPHGWWRLAAGRRDGGGRHRGA